MNFKMTSNKILIGVLVLLVLALFASNKYRQWEKQKQVLEKQKKSEAIQNSFRSIETDLNDLVAMSSADYEVLHVYKSFDFIPREGFALENGKEIKGPLLEGSWPRQDNQFGYNKDRWGEYVTILNKIKAGTLHRAADGSIAITMNSPNGSDGQAYLYIPDSVSKYTAEIYKQYPHPEMDISEDYDLTKLDNGWYLWYWHYSWM